jgi:predicted RNA binding protein YcfA (HicA-like mRNA interferase family)
MKNLMLGSRTLCDLIEEDYI